MPNDLLNTTATVTDQGRRSHSEKPLWFFLERYNQAFINQVISFVDCNHTTTQTTASWRYTMACVRFSWLRLLPSPAATAVLGLRLLSNYPIA